MEAFKMTRQLYRSRRNAVIAGVCGGLGEYFDVDPVLVRIIWLIALFSGIGVILYFLCWLLIPQRPLGQKVEETSQYEDGYYNEDYYQSKDVRKEKTKVLLGTVLIIVGSFSLMQRFMPWFDFDLIWPMLLILGGFYLIYREKDDHDEE
jgi:phage shock protein PspC (stress-responsive transcriptional regulator)